LLMMNPSTQRLLNILPAAIYTCDLAGRVTYYNQAAADLWGRAPELNKDLWCGSFKIFLTNGAQLPLEDCPMAEVLKYRTVVKSQEIVVERPDGVRKNVMVHPKLISDTDGNHIGAINMLIDITDKKENEDALRISEGKYRKLTELLELKVEERTQTLKLSEQRYHKMVEEVQDYAIMLLDTDGTILNWNQGIKKIKGYTEKEIVGQNFRIFYLPEDLEKKLPDQLMEKALREGRATHEGWRLKKMGGKFWGSVVLTLLHDEDGEPMGFSKVTRDLTERKMAEDRMMQYARDIEFRNRQLEEYAHVASHDLQEPLRKVQIFSDMLKDNLGDKEKTERYLERIRSSANRMSSLIRDVLLYSEVSNTEGLFRKVDLNEALTNVMEDLSLLIQEKGARVVYDDLPSIDGIPIQMHQLFSNLITNALKFASKKPEVKISGKLAKPGDLKKIPGLILPAKYLKLVIKDNGIGFDPKFAETIFILFTRLNHNALGNGIGLPLCKKIVENHRGHIEVKSLPNIGTTFTVYLPVNRKAAPKAMSNTPGVLQ
jgi:PAS domain S-box-containing protein